MAKKYIVNLTEDERVTLERLTKTGKRAARTIARAQILLHADAGMSDATIAAALRVGTATVERVRKRFVLEGVDSALTERPRPGTKPLLDAHAEAVLVAWTCSTPPDHRKRWTMQLLADKLVEVGEVSSVSDETVRRALKKTSSSPGKSKNGAFQP
jgi:transposase